MEQRIADYPPSPCSNVAGRINTNFVLPCGGTRVACETCSRHGCLYSKNVRRDRLVRSHPDKATHATPPPNRHERDFLSHTPISARNFRRFVGRDQKIPAATKTFFVVAGVSPVTRGNYSRHGCLYRTLSFVPTCVVAGVSRATDLILQPTSRVSIRQPTTRAQNQGSLERKSERDPA